MNAEYLILALIIFGVGMSLTNMMTNLGENKIGWALSDSICAGAILVIGSLLLQDIGAIQWK